MTTLDPRIIQVGIQVGSDLRIYQDGAITVNITKSCNALQNEATVTVTGLSKQVRDQLLTETSPYNKNYTPKALTISAGRQSTGPFSIYSGNIIESSVSQPPDIVTTIKSKTLNFLKQIVIARSFAARTQLSVIATRVAADLGLTLVFEATDRSIGNFSFTGAQTKFVNKLNEVGGVNAYIDDSKLVVKNTAVPLQNVVHVLSEASGMIGSPELTDIGVRVKYLLDPNTQLGGKLTIQSSLNPQLSGDYTIYNLSHVLATRDVAFYTIADCVRPGRLDNSTGFPVTLPTS